MAMRSSSPHRSDLDVIDVDEPLGDLLPDGIRNVVEHHQQSIGRTFGQIDIAIDSAIDETKPTSTKPARGSSTRPQPSESTRRIHVASMAVGSSIRGSVQATKINHDEHELRPNRGEHVHVSQAEWAEDQDQDHVPATVSHSFIG